MIRENQKVLNYIHVFTDGAILFASFPLGFWVRFYLFHGVITVPLSSYFALAPVYTVAQLFTYAGFGLYQSHRRVRLRTELIKLWEATALDMVILQSVLFLSWGIHYSRWALIAAFGLSILLLSVKRVALRLMLRRYRGRGYNQKHVLIVGGGRLARRYLREIRQDPELGYAADGYVAGKKCPGMENIAFLGRFEDLEDILEERGIDEAVAAMEAEDFQRTPEVIAACENAGVRLSIIPFYAEYIPSNPQFDDLNGIPLLNIRHIPLDNYANAFCKRAMDIVGSALALILLSPVMLLCAVGVKLSSPGPVIFRQERVGRNKRPFYMYKFRSMRVNDDGDTAWSKKSDPRKTRFGSFMRKCSLDELPQFWNVLRGDMSLVGPRPELPHYVERFRNEVPLYMVKHQVRPGITGWAQVNGFRGDTSIQGRIERDVYYIEHWSLLFDIQILFMTVFGGKFVNDEVIGKAEKPENAEKVGR